MKIVSHLHRYVDFFRDVATLMSGKTIAAAIALITTPIVARLFEPADFGVAAIFGSIIGIASSVASLSYGFALMIPKREDEALAVLAFAYRVVLLFCLVLLLVVFVMQSAGLELTVFGQLGPWVWFLPLGTFLMTVIRLQESWLTRQKKFGVSSVSLVTGNTVASGTRIGIGWALGSSAFGLIFGQLLGMIARLGIQWRACRESIAATLQRMSFKSMRRIAIQYADFPLLNAPAGLVFALGQNLPILLFGTMFSPAVAGFYAMASRLSRVPVTIGANAMRRVFLQRAADIHNRGRVLRRAFRLAIGGLIILGIVPFTVMWLYGEPVLVWLLGPRWAVAGQYVELIAPWMFMIWVMSPCNAVFIILRKQKSWLTLQTTLTVFRLGAFGLAYAIGAGPEWTLVAFVVATVAGNLLTMFTTFRLVSAGSPDQPEAGVGQ